MDDVERLIDEGVAELKLTEKGYRYTKPFPPGPNTHWTKGLAKIEEAKVRHKKLWPQGDTGPPAVEAGWTRVVSTTFDTPGVLPYPWNEYSGNVGSSDYSWWLPANVIVSGGICTLRNSYYSSGPGTGAGYDGSGGGWYQGSIVTQDNTTNDWGQVTPIRMTFRMRVVSVGGIVSHRNLPLRWGQPSTPPETSGIRGTSGDGEEDWHENDGPFTTWSCFIHWYINHLNRDGPPDPSGPGTSSGTWTNHDVRDWHIYKIQRVGQTITGWLDGVQALSKTHSDTDDFVTTADRAFVFQVENKHSPPFEGPSSGYEDIQLDWITIDV